MINTCSFLNLQNLFHLLNNSRVFPLTQPVQYLYKASGEVYGGTIDWLVSSTHMTPISTLSSPPMQITPLLNSSRAWQRSANEWSWQKVNCCKSLGWQWCRKVLYTLIMSIDGIKNNWRFSGHLNSIILKTPVTVAAKASILQHYFQSDNWKDWTWPLCLTSTT